MVGTKQQGIISDNIPLGFSAVSPPPQMRSPNSVNVLPPSIICPSPAPSSASYASSLPNSVYSTTDLRCGSPNVLGYLPVPVHTEKNLESSTKPIIYHQFNGIISRRNWYLAMVRRIGNEIPNEVHTTCQILSGR